VAEPLSPEWEMVRVEAIAALLEALDLPAELVLRDDES